MTKFTFTNRRGLPPGRGGLAALGWPLLLILLALGTMRGSGTIVTEPSGPLLGGFLLLLAAPTTWLAALLRLSPVVAVVLGTATSLPLWFLLGHRLASSAPDWGTWWRRYAVWALGSNLAVVVVVAVAASITG